MDKDKEKPSNSDETEIVVADEATTRLAILKSIAAGAVVFGIAGITPKAAAAGPIRFINMQDAKTIQAMNISGKTVVAALEKAGLNPKLLDLQALLGSQVSRADINELEKRLTGKVTVEWEITIKVTL